MGMDNTFFRVKKTDLKDKTCFDFIDELIYQSGKYDEYELVYFRKNYRLNEVIEDVLKEDYIECIRITKEQLKEIIEILNKDYEKINSIEDETEMQAIRRIYLDGTIRVLETIYKVFNFEEDYLIYECIY